MPQKTGAQEMQAHGMGVDPSRPTYLQAERSAQRPSTPKGVGRYAPVTSAGRGAKLLGRSGQGSGGGTPRGANGAAVKGANLASAAMWLEVAVEGVPRQRNTPKHPLERNQCGAWWGGAAGGVGV